MIHHGIAVLIKNGKITNVSDFWEYSKTIKDGWHLLTIKKPQSDITLQQHRYYRSIVLQTCQTAIHDATGGMWPTDEIHDELKKRFGVKKFILGGKSEVIKSMAQYSKDDYSEYLERIRAWLFDKFEVVLPSPHEYDLDDPSTKRTVLPSEVKALNNDR